MYKVVDIFGLTNQIIEREPTESELVQKETDKIAFEVAESKRLADEATKAAQKIALLDRLGLTADEAALLLS